MPPPQAQDACRALGRPLTAAAAALVAPPSALAESPAEAAQSARLLAAGAETIEALAALVAGFDGCPLKRTATNTVFIDGNPAAPVMIVGEAPGADEDRIGRPFVGRAGQLLDRMLAAIGLDRTQRPDHQRHLLAPARQPQADRRRDRRLPALRAAPHRAGAAARCWCWPAAPRPARCCRVTDGITRLRGRWFELAVPGLDAPVPTLPMFPPVLSAAHPGAQARSLARPAGPEGAPRAGLIRARDAASH